LAATAPRAIASSVSAASPSGSTPTNAVAGLSDATPAAAVALTEAAPTIISTLVDPNSPSPAASPVRIRGESAGR
jgi:hypothetical protein